MRFIAECIRLDQMHIDVHAESMKELRSNALQTLL